MSGVLWLGACPEPGCGLPAELIRTDRWESTDGPLETRRTRCLAGHVRDSHPVPVPLGRRMPCTYCGHDEHVLRCGADLGGALCPCRDVPVPGVYPEVPEEPS